MDKYTIMKLEKKYEDKIVPTSLLNWFPFVMDKVPVPKTEIVELKRIKGHQGIPVSWNFDKVKEAVKKVGGYPVFVRTDLASNKHDMENASKINSDEDLNHHISRVIEFNEMAEFLGLSYVCLVIREWLDLWQPNSFKAFNGTVIGKELRFFINESKVKCWHYYWPEESMRFPKHYEKIIAENMFKENESDKNIIEIIEKDFDNKIQEIKKVGPDGWKDKLYSLKKSALSDIENLLPKVNKIAKEFEDYWSIDFAQASNGTWYLIDMAVGEKSWHPECEIKDNINRKDN